MTNVIKQRSQSETSKILKGFSDKNKQIRVGSNKRVNDIFRNQIADNENLANTRREISNKIAEINQQYVEATQNVLNDETLDFLVKHSQIDAPTFTSIMAGFELAKKSRADKLNEFRQFEVDRQARQIQINQDLAKSRQQQRESELDQIRAEQKDLARESQFTTSQQLDEATREDTQRFQREQQEDRQQEGRVRSATDAVRRAGESQIEFERRVELARIQQQGRRSRGDDDELATLLSIASTPVGTSQQPDQQTAQPVAPQPTTPDPVAPVTPPQPVQVDGLDVEVPPPSEVPGLIDDTTDVVEPVEFGESARSFFAFNRDRQRSENDPPVPTGPELNLINTIEDLNEDETLRLQQLITAGLLDEELGDDEFSQLVADREQRDGEIVPLQVREFSQLDEADQRLVTERRLERADEQGLLIPAGAQQDDQVLDGVSPVAENPGDQPQSAFNSDVIEQIDILNQREDVEAIDPVGLEAQLVDQGIDVANLTIEQFNRLVEEDGELE